jgi:hypothetical protein
MKIFSPACFLVLANSYLRGVLASNLRSATTPIKYKQNIGLSSQKSRKYASIATATTAPEVCVAG